MVLGLEAGDHRVAPRDVRHRQHPGRLHEVEPAGGSEAEHAIVPLPDVVVGPKQCLRRLLRGPRCAVEAAEFLDLIEVLSVLLARQRIGAVRTELRCAFERERTDSRQPKAKHRRQGIAWVSLPDAGAGGRRVEVGERRVPLPAVVRAQRGHGRGHLLADCDAVRLRRAVRDSGKVGRVVPVENRLLCGSQAEGRLQADQRVVSRCRDGGRR